MATQQQFCHLFQTAPTVALSLLPDLPADAAYAFSTPVFHYAGTEFRLDGLLTPEDPQLPLICIALPMSPDSKFYFSYLAGVLAYLHEYAWDRSWRGLLLLPQRRMRLGFDEVDDDLFERQVTRVYLEELREQSDLSAEQLLLLLIAAAPAEVADLHQRVLAAPAHHLTPARLQALAEMIVTDRQRALAAEKRYAGVASSFEELLQSRFAQEIRAEGYQKGLRDVALRFVQRQLPRICGPVSPARLTRIQAMSCEQLEDLALDLLDFSGVADLEAWMQRLG